VRLRCRAAAYAAAAAGCLDGDAAVSIGFSKQRSASSHPIKTTGEEDDFLTSDAGTDGGGGRGSGAGDRLYGNLKTTLTWLPGGSGVPIVGVRQLLSGGRGVEIKVCGFFLKCCVVLCCV
jgi:hypothetical protein